MQNSRVFAFLNDRLARGEPVALVTLLSVTGGATRDPGAHMAVAADGAFCGSLSGGCIEAAIASEAQAALAEGRPRIVRYGAGSPYIDIRLPCGGGVELLVSPVDAPFGRALAIVLAERRAFSLSLPMRNGVAQVADAHSGPMVACDADRAIIRHAPPLRLFVLGEGDQVDRLAMLARAADIPARIFAPVGSPTASRLAAGFDVTTLRSPADTGAIDADDRTAIIFLFHDHDWEGPLVAAALNGPACYVGAMGSHRTQIARDETLVALGVSSDARARLHAPIGLLPAMRDPTALAISILAEIVAERG
ncbi:XdhC family protein [Sphingomonas sp.]